MSNENQKITTDQHNIIIYNSPDGKASVALYAKDGTVWMNQKQIADLFATSVPNISIHISNILEEQELEENSVVKDYLTTAADGKDYQVTYYALEGMKRNGVRCKYELIKGGGQIVPPLESIVRSCPHFMYNWKYRQILRETNDMETKIAVFKGKEVRKTIHNDEWWFVVEDVVVVLTDSVNPKDYINKMRRRDKELSKGYGQFVHTLPIVTEGGTQRMNCANTEGIFRIILGQLTN